MDAVDTIRILKILPKSFLIKLASVQSSISSKNACDCVGGTMKRAAAHEGLQLPLLNPILTPKQLYDFASQVTNHNGTAFCSTI